MKRLPWRNRGSIVPLISGVVGIISYFCPIHAAVAQSTSSNIIPDDSLNVERSVFQPTPGVELIRGGAERGQNLFHSFKEFNVEQGRRVYFYTENPGIRNILARVTGTTRSEILGTLGTLSAVPTNLFLINPNGIFFGTTAQLDVSGSFVATTANAIQFGNQGNFSATDPKAPSLLTIQPSALLFTQLAISSIENRAKLPVGTSPTGVTELFGLRVPDGQSLLLVGGDVTSRNGDLNALQGRVELGGLAKPGVVGLTVNQNTLSLDFPTDSPFSNISLLEDARIFVRGTGNGDVFIHADRFTLQDGGRIVAGTEGTGKAGDIVIRANLTQMNGRGTSPSGFYNLVLPDATGQGGNVLVQGRSFAATSGALIDLATFGIGDAGNFNLTASNAVEVGNSTIRTFSGEGAIGNAGHISITTGAFSASGSLIDASGFFDGNGNSGDVRITADSMQFSEGSEIFLSNFDRNSGNVELIAKNNIRFENGSFVMTANSGQGNSGRIDIRSGGAIALENGSSLGSSILFGGRGRGGDISIVGDSLLLSQGSAVSAFSSTGERAGNISVRTASFVHLDTNSSLSAFAFSAIGGGGSISIQTPKMSILNGSSLLATVRGDQPAGKILLNVPQFLELGGSSGRISSRIEISSSGRGDAGDIILNTGKLVVRDGALIRTVANAEGNGGQLVINATDSIELRGATTNGIPSLLDARSAKSGASGNITINTRRLFIRDGAGITTVTLGSGQGGKIEVNASEIVSISGSDPFFNQPSELTTQTFGSGTAGNVVISTPTLELDRGQLTVSSGSEESPTTGKAGELSIIADSVYLRDRGAIEATTRSGNGGNIALQLRDLLVLRNNSKISTTAGIDRARGDGGNISISAPFIVAIPSENSDITANAFTGSGGRIQIETQSILGTQFRQNNTQESDITASSTFGVAGVVEINTPEVDPSRGLAELPSIPIDASQQLAQACPTGSPTAQLNAFYITGRGGLPPNPTEAIVPSHTLIASESENGSAQGIFTSPSSIVEAQTWVKRSDGTIELVAQADDPVVERSPQSSVCASSVRRR